MAKQNSKPPLKRVYWTAELKKVAIARLQGGISWAELLLVNDSIGLQQGVLLFDTLEAATAYIKRKSEDFAVVVELPVKSIEKELLVRLLLLLLLLRLLLLFFFSMSTHTDRLARRPPLVPASPLLTTCSR